MKPEDINRAIAGHLGWAWYAVEKGGWYYRQGGHGYTNRIQEAGRYTKDQAEKELVRGEPMRIVQIPYPNYYQDLNAMHEAEKTIIDQDDQNSYVAHLVANLHLNSDTIPSAYDEAWVCRHSNARQCAEAFLRTIRKWRDE